jgi:hypothetical protein
MDPAVVGLFAAVVGLAGALTGALVAWRGTVLQVRANERQAEATRIAARAERLFDHRRTAYAEFISTSRNFAYGIEDQYGPDPDGDDWDPLIDRLADLELVASDPVVERAHAVREKLIGSVTGDNDVRAAYVALASLVQAARADLRHVDTSASDSPVN